MTSVIGKMLESIIADIIRDHLGRHNFIHDSQHEFIKGLGRGFATGNRGLPSTGKTPNGVLLSVGSPKVQF